MVCPELTEQIRREVAASLHQRKGDFTCYFLTDLVTFTLPAGQHLISKQIWPQQQQQDQAAYSSHKLVEVMSKCILFL